MNRENPYAKGKTSGYQKRDRFGGDKNRFKTDRDGYIGAGAMKSASRFKSFTNKSQPSF